MIQEEKDLLLQDLCARLPYGVMLKHISTEKPFKLFSIKRDEYVSYKKDSVELAVNGIYYDWYVNDTYHDIELYIKPYLRPMSSMTEEEYNFIYNGHNSFWVIEDYCNKHHLDYRGLIPKGLAIEAPEGMYK